MNKKKFAKPAFNEESEIFIVHAAALKALLAGMRIHPSQKTLIFALKQDEALTKVSPKYTDYAVIFLFDLAIELS